MPKSGERYRHYKGNEYEIVCLAKLESDLSSVVVYRDVHDPEKIWVRPLDMFMESVEVDGASRPRFERLG